MQNARETKSNSEIKGYLYDDILIFATTKKNAEKYKSIATEILEGELMLTVNIKKAHIANINDGVPYLGFTIHREYISIQNKRIEKFKDKIRNLTPRNGGISIEMMMKKLNSVIRGWSNYFRIVNHYFER